MGSRGRSHDPESLEVALLSLLLQSAGAFHEDAGSVVVRLRVVLMAADHRIELDNRRG